MGLVYLTCRKCNHRWIPKVENPIKCPNPSCQSHKWNQSLKEEIMERFGFTEKELEEEIKKILSENNI